MFAIIPLLAWTGGIAAGAQVAAGVVRGVGELVRGRPGAAVLEVADGCVAPLRMACHEVSNLGHDVYLAVLAPWQNELGMPATTSRHRPRRRNGSTDLENELLNGIAGLSEVGA